MFTIFQGINLSIGIQHKQCLYDENEFFSDSQMEGIPKVYIWRSSIRVELKI